MRRLSQILLFLWICATVSQGETTQLQSPVDYMKATGRICGIAEVHLNDDGSVTLVDAEDLFFLYKDDGSRVGRLTIEPGGSFVLTDLYHAAMRYEINRIEAEMVNVSAVYTFTFPGIEDKQDELTLNISPYARPLPTRVRDGSTADKCLKRLESIILPEFSGENLSGKQALQLLDDMIVRFDPAGEGVPFVFDPVVYDNKDLTFSLPKVRAIDALHIAAILAGLEFSIEDGFIAVFYSGRKRCPTRGSSRTGDPRGGSPAGQP